LPHEQYKEHEDGIRSAWWQHFNKESGKISFDIEVAHRLTERRRYV
jgi:hypothetical protein